MEKTTKAPVCDIDRCPFCIHCHLVMPRPGADEQSNRGADDIFKSLLSLPSLILSSLPSLILSSHLSNLWNAWERSERRARAVVPRGELRHSCGSGAQSSGRRPRATSISRAAVGGPGEQRGQLAVPVRGPGGRVACGKRSRVRSSLLLGRFRLGVAVAGWRRGASTPSSPWGRSGIHKLLNSAARIP